MRKYTVYLFYYFLLICLIGNKAISEEEPDELAWRNYSSAEQSLTNASVDLSHLLGIRGDIEVEIRANNEDMSENLKDFIGAFAPSPGQPSGDPASALIAFAKHVKDSTDAILLSSSHSDCQSSIMSQYNLILTRISEADTLYSIYVTEHGGTADKIIRSNLVLNVSFKCLNCSVSFSTSQYGGEALQQSLTAHHRTCPEKHDTSGVTGVKYWECENNVICPRASEHWRLCPSSCDEKFPPKKLSRGMGNYDYISNFPHEVKCNEDVYDGFWKFWAKCFGTYGESSVWYTCERSSCQNSGLHDDGNSNSYYDEDGSGSTSENTPSTPSYHVCGVHLTSVAGDHSMQASCTGTDSNGNDCDVINFYACDGHTHEGGENLPTCLHCGWEYDPENNYAGACIYHWSNYYHFSYSE